LSARQIAKLRKREDASQAVFAHHLGVSVGLISQWERGEKKPQGASLKLLTLVDKKGLDWVA
jgi:putative transcriptional regulator